MGDLAIPVAPGGGGGGTQIAAESYAGDGTDTGTTGHLNALGIFYTIKR